ncbi:MAG: hypothetical protein LJE83_07005 [Gammaproteobacteria bacterium]|nr:hypothetical protein [Gammaproteobacteria bacterium]
MDTMKFLLTILLLIISMQSLALYLPAGEQVNQDNAVVANLWVAGFFIEDQE